MASRHKDSIDPRAGTLGKPTTGKGVWSGEAVARARGEEAEAGALRAEGHGPVSGARALDENRSDVDKRTRKPPAVKQHLSQEDIEAAQRLKQEAAAEEHRRVQAERGVGPHGKL
ncbi:MAG: hypothetical protein SF187_25420 [Deltaproteobacteria bacterium]|nr:hypothetical protein [Deltaproteobacteria bacterium]